MGTRPSDGQDIVKMKAESYLYESYDGWRLLIRFEDGREVVSDQVYPTKEACAEAFKAWSESNGVDIERPN